MSSVKNYEGLLKAGRWFGGLPDGFRQALLDAAVVRKLGKGEQLFARGDAPSGLYAVVDGTIRASTLGPSGKEILLAMIASPMWFGEISVLDGHPRTHDATADEETTLVHVPAAALDAMLARAPAWWRELGVLVCGKLRLSFLVVEDIAMPLAVRVARRLVLTAERYGEWTDRSSKVVEIRQEQLATMLSVSRQTVNQALKDLEGKGLVRLAYGKVEIVDLDGLRAMASVP
jgi:CRP-like cAMP-binding protein